MCERCNYSELLEKSGLPPTPHRLRVLETIGNSPAPLDYKAIYRALEEDRHPINRVTLYRILDLLVEKGLIERIGSGSRAPCYGPAPNAHHPRHPHFYCSVCGSMECLDPGSLHVDVRAIQEAYPVQIQKVEIRLDGICGHCLMREDGAHGGNPEASRCPETH